MSIFKNVFTQLKVFFFSFYVYAIKDLHIKQQNMKIKYSVLHLNLKGFLYITKKPREVLYITLKSFYLV